MADLLKLANLARSTFYYQRKSLQAADKYEQLKEQIRTIFNSHKGCYGYRRITAGLRQLGRQVNHKTVQRVMSTLGLKSQVRQKKYRSFKGEVGHVAPNALQRQFNAKTANQKWVTDVTEFHVAGEKLYLSPVLDLYNGEIVAFETSKRPAFELVNSMLKKALAKLGPNERRACQIFCVERGHEIIPRGLFHDRCNDHEKAQEAESCIPFPRRAD